MMCSVERPPSGVEGASREVVFGRQMGAVIETASKILVIMSNRDESPAVRCAALETIEAGYTSLNGHFFGRDTRDNYLRMVRMRANDSSPAVRKVAVRLAGLLLADSNNGETGEESKGFMDVLVDQFRDTDESVSSLALKTLARLIGKAQHLMPSTIPTACLDELT